MKDRFEISEWELAVKDRMISFVGYSLLIIKPVAIGGLLDYCSAEGIARIPLTEGGTTLVASIGKASAVSRNGAWRNQRLSLDWMMKLCAFLDHGAGVAVPCTRTNGQVITHINADMDAKNIETWLIGSILGGESSVKPLLEMMRTQEPYRLVRFLLSEHGGAKSIAALGERYGLSKSHFNRLCRQVLGNGVKRELRLWRAVEAMLDVFDRRSALTAIAYEHGYSSTSHFSREIKQLFGVSPRRFPCLP
jgi:AraC-like DNA-binding protein